MTKNPRVAVENMGRLDQKRYRRCSLRYAIETRLKVDLRNSARQKNENENSCPAHHDGDNFDIGFFAIRR